MGEVIDISIISHKNDIAEKVMYFMEGIFELENGIKNIEVMDNWHYENMFNLNTLDEAKKYIDSKIITLTENSLDKQTGVSIEHFSDYYRYDFWYNTTQEIFLNECKRIYDKFVNYILDKLRNNIMICMIGREILIDYDMNINKMMRGAHNVDIWIIKKNIYEKYKLRKQEKSCVILI